MIIISALHNLLQYITKLTRFIEETIFWLFARKLDIKAFVREMLAIGIYSFPLVSLISFFVGIIIAFQTAYQLRTFKLEYHIASLVVLSLTRELGPVIGSLIVAARSGAAITAQLGAMKISEQIDALEVMGVSPIHYLVVPKFLSLLISMPLLIIYADVLGVLGGFIVGSTKFAIPFNLYMRMTFDALAYKDIISGMVKSFCFGSIIAFISCYEGFQPYSSSDVAKVVTNSVVRSFFLIILFDCLLTAIFYFLVI